MDYKNEIINMIMQIKNEYWLRSIYVFVKVLLG